MRRPVISPDRTCHGSSHKCAQRQAPSCTLPSHEPSSRAASAIGCPPTPAHATARPTPAAPRAVDWSLVRLIFAGTPQAAVPSLEALLESEHEVVAVLTRPDAPVGRKRVLTPSPVKVRAQDAGIPVLEADRLRGEILTEIEALAPDVVAVVAYGAVAGPRALSAARHGWFNLHFSRLPTWRGAAPVQRAIMAGETVSGVTVFRLDTGVDTGDVVAGAELPLPEIDAGAVLEDYAVRGSAVLVEALDAVAAGTAEFRAQSGEASHAAKITPDEAQLDFTRSATAVSALARGVTPQPGAWALLDGARTKLFGIRAFRSAAPSAPARPEGSDAAGHPRDSVAPLDASDAPEHHDDSDAAPAATAVPPPGRLTRIGDTIVVGTGDGAISITEIQPFGKPRMPALDFHRGRGDIDFDLEENA